VTCERRLKDGISDIMRWAEKAPLSEVLKSNITISFDTAQEALAFKELDLLLHGHIEKREKGYVYTTILPDYGFDGSGD